MHVRPQRCIICTPEQAVAWGASRKVRRIMTHHPALLLLLQHTSISSSSTTIHSISRLPIQQMYCRQPICHSNSNSIRSSSWASVGPLHRIVSLYYLPLPHLKFLKTLIFWVRSKQILNATPLIRVVAAQLLLRPAASPGAHCTDADVIALNPKSKSRKLVWCADLVSSTGCPSPGGVTTSAAATGGPSLGPPFAGSGVPSSADAELAQLDGAFWSELPPTPDFSAPAEPPEGPPEAPLHLPVPALSPFQDTSKREPPECSPTSDPRHESSSTGCSLTAPAGGPQGRQSSKGEPLFADLMELASDKLNISLSPRTHSRNPKT